MPWCFSHNLYKEHKSACSVCNMFVWLFPEGWTALWPAATSASAGDCVYMLRLHTLLQASLLHVLSINAYSGHCRVGGRQMTHVQVQSCSNAQLHIPAWCTQDFTSANMIWASDIAGLYSPTAMPLYGILQVCGAVADQCARAQPSSTPSAATRTRQAHHKFSVWG